MQSKVDYTFGKVSFYDYFWRTTVAIKLFGKELDADIIIDCYEDEDFSQLQRDAFLNFQSDKARIIQDVCIGIFDYYCGAIVTDYRTMLGEEADLCAPVIDDWNDMARVVSFREIIIKHGQKNGSRTLGFLFDCTWSDKGVGVKIENETVTMIGFQDIVL